MRESHVFSITSLKDLTSTVAIEAISLGLPLVSLDHCGFADLVTEECGIKIYPGSTEQIISDFAKAICTLYRDEKSRRCLAQGSLSRSQDYAWHCKMDSLDDVYTLALESQGHRAGEGQTRIAPTIDVAT
jgi:glycosyltransferase involved in cell wall biosynthesis